ncbi:MAG: 3-hydroxyisobutyrate dehydrogenase [Pseudomonadota bacterium]
MRIGFIGLGNMGAGMAANLVKAGHDVAGYDVQPVEVDGITATASATEAVDGADAVITMLPNGAILKSVCADIVGAMRPGSLFIDCSTVDVASSREVHTKSEQAELLSLDAPVSGGIGGAQAGTLTFMVGGSEESFAQGAPLFEIMGQKAVHCGDAGSGQAAKICNNMLLGISMIGACEAFALGKKLGLSGEKLFDVVSTSSGACWSVNTYCPVPGVGPQSPADNGYTPGFAADLMLKDLRLSQEAAQQSGTDTQIGQRATEMYASLVDELGQGQDFSVFYKKLTDGTKT